MSEDIKNGFNDNTDVPADGEDGVIVFPLEDENGNVVEFEYLDTIEYEGIEYIYLISTEEESDEVVILKITSLDDENEVYESIDDEEFLQTLFDIFKDKWKDEFDFG